MSFKKLRGKKKKKYPLPQKKRTHKKPNKNNTPSQSAGGKELWKIYPKAGS